MLLSVAVFFARGVGVRGGGRGGGVTPKTSSYGHTPDASRQQQQHNNHISCRGQRLARELKPDGQAIYNRLQSQGQGHVKTGLPL